MDLIELPTPPDGSDGTCSGCGAPLAPDQRYCLACGRPCSPVRLAFLDVLQAEHQPTTAYAVGGEVVGPGRAGPPSYPTPQDPDGMLGSLRRWSGLLALLGVLVGCLLVGLLVGHWVSQSNTPAGPQVVRIEGLSGPLAAAAAPAATTTSTTSHATTTPSTTGAAKTATTPASSKAEEAEESKEAKEKESKPLPAAHKASSTLKKLSETTGKKHAQEVNALGNAPIETGH